MHDLTMAVRYIRIAHDHYEIFDHQGFVIFSRKVPRQRPERLRKAEGTAESARCDRLIVEPPSTTFRLGKGPGTWLPIEIGQSSSLLETGLLCPASWRA